MEHPGNGVYTDGYCSLVEVVHPVTIFSPVFAIKRNREKGPSRNLSITNFRDWDPCDMDIWADFDYIFELLLYG